MLTALVDVILPVVLVAGVGILLGRTFPLDLGTLTKVQLYGLTPALAFSSLLETSVSLDDSIRLGVAFFLLTAVAGALAAVVALRSPAGTRRGIVACTVLGNNGNFGLPIALLALGQQGLDQAIVILLYSLVAMWTIGPTLLGAHGGGLRAAARILARLPVTWALVSAIALKITGLTPPTGVATGIELLGSAAVPMVLLSLGLQLAASKRIHLTRPVITATVLRVFAIPPLAYGVGLLCGLEGLALQSLVLAAAMPTAVNAFMLAQEYGADAETVASVVALSTLISIGTIAFVVSVLPALG